MKKAIYITILSLITVGCIVWRVCGGVLNNPFHHSANDERKKQETVSTSAETLQPFSQIDIDVNLFDIKIEKGSSYSISYNAPKKDIPKYAVKDDGTLEIREPGVNNTYGFQYIKANLTLTVPEEVSFSNVKINTECGDVDLKGLTMDDIECITEAGDMKISDLTATDFKCSAEAGDAEISNLQTVSSSFNFDAGNGDIDDSKLGTCNIDADCGNVEMKNVVFEDTDIEADAGNVTIQTPGDPKDYSMDIKSDYGNVKINGKNVNGDYHSDGGSYYLSVSADAGNVNIRFE